MRVSVGSWNLFLRKFSSLWSQVLDEITLNRRAHSGQKNSHFSNTEHNTTERAMSSSGKAELYQEALTRDKESRGGARRFLTSAKYASFRRHVTPEKELVEETKILNGRKVLGLTSKRGKPACATAEEVEKLRKRVQTRITKTRKDTADSLQGARKTLLKVCLDEARFLKLDLRQRNYYQRAFGAKQWGKWVSRIQKNAKLSARQKRRDRKKARQRADKRRRAT